MGESVFIGTMEPYSELGWEIDKGCYVFFYENYLSPGAGYFHFIKTDEGPVAYVTPGNGTDPDEFWVEIPPGWEIVGTQRHTAEDEGDTYTIRACPLVLT